MFSLDRRSQGQEFETRTIRISHRRATYSTVALRLCVEDWSGERGKSPQKRCNWAVGMCSVNLQCIVAVSIVGRSAHSAVAFVRQNACFAVKDNRKEF